MAAARARGRERQPYGLRIANEGSPSVPTGGVGPLRVIGEAVMGAIDKHVLGLDAHALRRQHPTVKLQRPGPDDAANEPFAHARFDRR